jgi:putative copper export protein
LTTSILWIHATAGALWIGACACFVIAGLALTPGSDEHRNFVARSAPKIDHLAMLAAALLFLTGLVNLVQAAISRHFAFSTAFTTVLAIKILLFIAMLATMRSSMKTGAMNRMVKAHAAIVAMGAVALLLGLWLIGS